MKIMSFPHAHAVVLAAACLFGPTGVALAAPPTAPETQDDVVSLPVSYADLDLTTPVGAKVMLNRIKTAADEVCGGRPDAREMQNFRLYRLCLDKTVHGGVAGLNAPEVTALYNPPARELLARR